MKSIASSVDDENRIKVLYSHKQIKSRPTMILLNEKEWKNMRRDIFRNEGEDWWLKNMIVTQPGEVEGYEVLLNDKVIIFWRADVMYDDFSAEVLFMNDGKFTCCFDEKTFWLNRGEVEGYEEIPFHPQIASLIEKYCLDDLEIQSNDILKELASVLLCYIRNDKIDSYSNSSDILKDISEDYKLKIEFLKLG